MYEYWTDQSGTEWNIRDMTSIHLRNTINMLRRMNVDLRHYGYIISMQRELDRRSRRAIHNPDTFSVLSSRRDELVADTPICIIK